MERELRRGLDRADIWGATMVYEPVPTGGQELVMACWSDKGTVHVWRDVLGVKRLADVGKVQVAESYVKSENGQIADYLTCSCT